MVPAGLGSCSIRPLLVTLAQLANFHPLMSSSKPLSISSLFTSKVLSISGLLFLTSCGLLFFGYSALMPSASVFPRYSIEDAPRQLVLQNRAASLSAIFGSGDGKALWAVGQGGTILHSAA
jgi:hypothetical protein